MTTGAERRAPPSPWGSLDEPDDDLDFRPMRRTATKVSVLDVLEAEGAVQPRTVWHRLCRREPVWLARATPHQFAGRGQRPTPVITAEYVAALRASVWSSSSNSPPGSAREVVTDQAEIATSAREVVTASGRALIQGDSLMVLKTMPPHAVDAVVTDPPAGISWMRQRWDSDKGGRDAWVEWLTEVMRECMRVLKPGGHALVWAMPRTAHWTTWAIESAGFEVRDVIAHVHGQGVPQEPRRQQGAR